MAVYDEQCESSKQYLFNKLKARLKAEVPELKTFELFQDQFNNEDVEAAFLYPAAFLQFASLIYEDRLGFVQDSNVVITLHVGVKSLNAKDVSIFTILDKIFWSLNGFSDDSDSKIFTNMSRKAERQTVSLTNVNVWEVDYTTRLSDFVAHKTNRRKLVVQPVTLQVDKDIVDKLND